MWNRCLIVGLSCLLPQVQPARGVDLLVSNRESGTVLRFDGDTGEFIEVFALVESPLGMEVDTQDNLFVASSGADRLLSFDMATGGQTNTIDIHRPTGVGLSPAGDVYVASQLSDSQSQVWRYTGAPENPLESFVDDSHLDAVNSLIFGPDGHLYVSDSSQRDIVRFDGATGEFIDDFAGGGLLSTPVGLTFGPDQNLYVASFDSSEIVRFDGATGDFIDVFAAGEELEGPAGLQFGPGGLLYVTSFYSNEVLRYDGGTGEFVDVFASGSGMRGPADLLFADVAKPATLPYVFDLTGGEFEQSTTLAASSGDVTLTAANPVGDATQFAPVTETNVFVQDSDGLLVGDDDLQSFDFSFDAPLTLEALTVGLSTLTEGVVSLTWENMVTEESATVDLPPGFTGTIRFAEGLTFAAGELGRFTSGGDPIGVNLVQMSALIAGIPSHSSSADFNEDGVVDGGDFLLWQRQYGAVGSPAADGDGDGTVTGADLALWESNFGRLTAISKAGVVPEPTAAILLMSSLFSLRCTRWRPKIYG